MARMQGKKAREELLGRSSRMIQILDVQAIRSSEGGRRIAWSSAVSALPSDEKTYSTFTIHGQADSMVHLNLNECVPILIILIPFVLQWRLLESF